ncbi:hypothetical protein ACFL27_02505 [candidate division CSSED10-310 bacterium]|uniref:HEAT repeat domain-containing protein n=1 Tax=candidate division CSSED10-310 bacterium TaxID=2855610 RepID=A0ABV6YSJ3_UNCC1
MENEKLITALIEQLSDKKNTKKIPILRELAKHQHPVISENLCKMFLKLDTKAQLKALRMMKKYHIPQLQEQYDQWYSQIEDEKVKEALLKLSNPEEKVSRNRKTGYTQVNWDRTSQIDPTLPPFGSGRTQ